MGTNPKEHLSKMVVLNHKIDDKNMFLYETSVTKTVDETVSELVAINNLRLRLSLLAEHVKDLADHGPMKPVEEQGLDDVYDEEGNIKPTDTRPAGPDERINPDPSARRTGRAPASHLAEVLMRTVTDAVALLHHDNVKRKEFTTMKGLTDAWDCIKGAVMIVYPGGLPEWEVVRHFLEGTEDLAGTQHGRGLLEDGQASLWWAGKEMVSGNLLSHHLGKNEKTKVICRVQKKGASAPQREAPITEEEKRNMMAHYHKKQEEFKKLAEDDDDSYMTSQWANPKGLKNSLQGVSAVSWNGRK